MMGGSGDEERMNRPYAVTGCVVRTAYLFKTMHWCVDGKRLPCGDGKRRGRWSAMVLREWP